LHHQAVGEQVPAGQKHKVPAVVGALEGLLDQREADLQAEARGDRARQH